MNRIAFALLNTSTNVWEASPDADFVFELGTFSASEMPPTYVFNRADCFQIIHPVDPVNPV
jgi:hypothetical protein